jgi:hypothetical protein
LTRLALSACQGNAKREITAKADTKMKNGVSLPL